MMHRRLFLVSMLAVGCKAMDFTLDYTFSDGPARVHTALTIRGNRGLVFRHVAAGAEKPIGVWKGTVSDATLDQLWKGMPAVAPAGTPLRPGMPNHMVRIKKEGVEKSLRLAHQAAVLEKVRPFIDLLETAQRESSSAEMRTLSIRFSGWNEKGATVELRAGGTEEVLIPNGADALVIVSAPVGATYPLTDIGRPIPGVIRITPGNTFLVSIPMARKDGFQYQASYRRRGVTKETGGEIFGDAGSAMAPK
jgi:hypothetical protein